MKQDDWNLLGKIMLGVVIFWFIYYYWIKKSDDDNGTEGMTTDFKGSPNFVYTAAQKQYGMLNAMLGPADEYINGPGGIFLWYPLRRDPNAIFNLIMLKDEKVLHCYPVKHYDYLYTSTEVNIPDSKLGMVLSISKTITYDRLKRWVNIRCNSMKANTATLWVIVKVVNGDFNKQQMTKIKDIYGAVMIKALESDEFYQKLVADIKYLLPSVNSYYDRQTAETEPCQSVDLYKLYTEKETIAETCCPGEGS